MLRNIRPGIRRWFRLALERDTDVRDDVEDEIRTHLELLAEQLRQRGWSEDEAGREAERQFGPLNERTAELRRLAHRRRRTRERTIWWSGVQHDLRVAVRNALRNPGVTIVATIVLSLGIGVTTAVFSVFDSVILRPLPYRDPSQLVVIWETARTASGEFASGVFDNARDAGEWANRSRSFDGLAELTWAMGSRVYWPESGSPRDIAAIPTSANLFEVLGARAERGRTFAAADEAYGCAVVLSNAFWRATFAGDPQVIGREIRLGASRCAVLGVMPASFTFYPTQTDLWSLMTPTTDTMLARHPDRYLVGVFGRLRRGVSAAAAQRELRAIQASGPDQTPFRRAFTPTVFDLHEEFTWLAGRNLHTTLSILLGAVGLVLLVVCVNVANLSLGRAAAREREFAVRVAIGSGRWRLVRQLLIEAAVLAMCGTMGGLAIASLGVAYVNSGKAIELPPGGAARLDVIALSAMIAMAFVATLIVGAAPAVRATAINTADALKSSSRSTAGGRRSGRVAKALVVSQVSASTILLVAAGLLLQSLVRFGDAPLGYVPDNLLTMQVRMADHDTVLIRRTMADALERVRSVPGVSDAAWTSVIPVNGRGSIEPVVVEGRAASGREAVPDVGEQTVSASYFDLMHVPLLAGRGFRDTDEQTTAPVAIVNQAFIDRYFGRATGPTVGRRIKVGGGTEPWLTIVGVVANEQRSTVTQEMGWSSLAMVFRPMTQTPASPEMHLIARSALGSAIAEPVRHAVMSTSHDVIIGDVATMRALLDQFLASPRTRARAVVALAVLALTLAVVGLYGMLSELVVQRTREIGIRAALGAQSGQIVALIVRSGLSLAVIGVALGGVLVVPTVRAIQTLLYGVSAFDPLTLAAAAGGMLVTAAVASVLPARRAASVDPAMTMRSD